MSEIKSVSLDSIKSLIEGKHNVSIEIIWGNPDEGSEEPQLLFVNKENHDDIYATILEGDIENNRFDWTLDNQSWFKIKGELLTDSEVALLVV